MITVPTNLLEAVASWALKPSEISDRVHLTQIRFCDDEMIAIDGCRGVIVPIATEGLSFGLRRVDALAAVAAGRMFDATSTAAIRIEPVRDGRLRLHLTEDGYPSLVVTACTEAMPIDEFRKIVNDPSLTAAPGEIGFNPKYLAAMDEVKCAITSGSEGVIVRRWGGPLDPMVFDGPPTWGGKRVRFAIMPMRLP